MSTTTDEARECLHIAQAKIEARAEARAEAMAAASKAAEEVARQNAAVQSKMLEMIEEQREMLKAMSEKQSQTAHRIESLEKPPGGAATAALEAELQKTVEQQTFDRMREQTKAAHPLYKAAEEPGTEASAVEEPAAPGAESVPGAAPQAQPNQKKKKGKK